MFSQYDSNREYSENFMNAKISCPTVFYQYAIFELNKNDPYTLLGLCTNVLYKARTLAAEH